MYYNIYKINRSAHSKYNCLSFEGIEQAILEFNHLTVLNKDHKDVVVCLTALNGKAPKIKKTIQRQMDKEQDDTKMLYKVVYTNILDVKEPSYYYRLYENLDEALLFFYSLTNKCKNNPDALICLCNAFDEDYTINTEAEQE